MEGMWCIDLHCFLYFHGHCIHELVLPFLHVSLFHSCMQGASETRLLGPFLQCTLATMLHLCVSNPSENVRRLEVQGRGELIVNSV